MHLDCPNDTARAGNAVVRIHCSKQHCAAAKDGVIVDVDLNRHRTSTGTMVVIGCRKASGVLLCSRLRAVGLIRPTCDRLTRLHTR
jgi:hypothetical protein